MYDVFIAHSSREKEKSLAIYNLLSDYRVFLDFISVKEGKDWDTEIAEAQKKSRVTLALISGDFQSAYYAREEVAAAISYSRKRPESHILIPVYLESISDDQIPYGLRLKHSIFLRGNDFSELTATLQRVLSSNDTPTVAPLRHFLLSFPRGPLVEGHLIRREIIEAYATSLKPFEFLQVIAEVNAFRKEADPDDPRVTIIKSIFLPPPGSVAPIQFWINVFDEACRHGPRMLASLLTVVPSDQFPEQAQTQKERLLTVLQKYK
jgi:hypothetical protein